MCVRRVLDAVDLVLCAEGEPPLPGHYLVVQIAGSRCRYKYSRGKAVRDVLVLGVALYKRILGNSRQTKESAAFCFSE
eukprot:scaffold7589_cov106-Isochrysis_galbana.AAC.2